MSPVLSLRRKLETGEAATNQDIAKADKVSTQFVGPILRLAYPGTLGNCRERVS
jgi:hypothetical protein